MFVISSDNSNSTKHYTEKDGRTQTPLKTGGEHRCSGRVGSSCSTSGTLRVTLIASTKITGFNEKTLLNTNNDKGCKDMKVAFVAS